VNDHASELGIDADRIAHDGGSAGGYLALAVALLPHAEAPEWTKRPPLLVLYNPATGLRGGSGGLSDHIAGKLPPTLIMHGDKDTTVPFARVERFAEKWRAAGGEIELAVFYEQKHAFFNYAVNPNNYFRTLREIAGFLAMHGWGAMIKRLSAICRGCSHGRQ
jgi:acetyl esterase